MAGDKLTKDETDSRIQKCYEFRFVHSKPFGVKDWLQYCATKYNDKSQQTYTKYWADAGNIYQETWKEKLNKQLDPAVNELIGLLANEDPRVRHDAAKSIFKYTGQDIQKIEADIKGEIKVSFGD